MLGSMRFIHSGIGSSAAGFSFSVGAIALIQSGISAAASGTAAVGGIVSASSIIDALLSSNAPVDVPHPASRKKSGICSSDCAEASIVKAGPPSERGVVSVASRFFLSQSGSSCTGVCKLMPRASGQPAGMLTDSPRQSSFSMEMAESGAEEVSRSEPVTCAAYGSSSITR